MGKLCTCSVTSKLALLAILILLSCVGCGSDSTPLQQANQDAHKSIVVNTAKKPVAVPGASPLEGSYPLYAHFFDAGSYDPDGEIVTWEWKFPGEAGWNDFTSTKGDVWYTFETPGNKIAHLRVTDDSGKKDIGAITIVVRADINSLPVAVASASPLYGNAPLEVTFSAAGSYDPDGTIQLYEWDFDDGAGFRDYTSSGGAATFTYNTGGMYAPVLRVTDDDGAISTAGVTLDINNLPVAVADAAPTSGFAPLAVSFDATGSTDTDGTIVSWEWDFGEGSGFHDYTASLGEASYTYTTAGNFGAVLRVTDDDGAQATDSVAIEVLQPQLQADWWAFGRDRTHHSRSTFSGPAAPQLAWKTQISNSLAYQCAVMDADGTAYVGSLDHNLYAINPDGSIKWTFLTGARIRASAMVGHGGTVYVSSEDGNFYAIDKNGTELWHYTLSAPIGDSNCSPIQAPDGTIYIGSNAGGMFAFTPSGTLKWSYPTGDGVESSPAVASDGTIYFGCLDHYLYALNPDGTLKWRYATAWRIITSSPAVADDGTVYIGTTTGGAYTSHFYAVNPDGSLKWQTSTDGYVYSSPGIAADGTVYFSDGRPGSGSLYAFNPDGSLKWKTALGDESASSPSIDASGTIYIGSGYVSGNQNAMTAFNPDGTVKWRYSTPGWVIGSATITDDGRILFGCGDGYLYALEEAGGSTTNWIHTWGGSGTDWARPIAVDSGGNVFAAGRTNSFGMGGYDALITKYSATGQLQWVKTWGGSSDEYLISAALDESGSLYCTGYSHSYTQGNADLLVLKIDTTSGNVLWAKTWGGSLPDSGSSIAMDSSGNVIVTGVNRIPPDNDEFAILKLDPSGSLIYQKRWGTGNDDLASVGIDIDASGNIYIPGRSTNNIVVVLKVTNDGNLVWQRQWPSGGISNGVRLYGNNLYVCAGANASPGFYRSALLQMDLDGNLNWASTWETGHIAEPRNLAVDSSGNIYLGGHTQSPSAVDMFLLKFDPTGQGIWQLSRDSGGDDFVFGVTSASDKLYYAGASLNTSGSWIPAGGTFGASSLGMSNINGSITNATYTLFDAPVTTGTPAGIEDTGGGGNDLMVGVMDL